MRIRIRSELKTVGICNRVHILLTRLDPEQFRIRAWVRCRIQMRIRTRMYGNEYESNYLAVDNLFLAQIRGRAERRTRATGLRPAPAATEPAAALLGGRRTGRARQRSATGSPELNVEAGTRQGPAARTAHANCRRQRPARKGR